MDIKQEVTAVEKELVELIIEHLKENKINADEARQLARDFLAVLPVTSQEDLLAKLKALGQKYDEVQELYVEEYSKASDKKDDTALNQMRDHIKQGNIEHAIAVAKSLQTGQ